MIACLASSRPTSREGERLTLAPGSGRATGTSSGSPRRIASASSAVAGRGVSPSSSSSSLAKRE